MITENFYFLNTRETEDNNQFEQNLYCKCYIWANGGNYGDRWFL